MIHLAGLLLLAATAPGADAADFFNKPRKVEVYLTAQGTALRLSHAGTLKSWRMVEQPEDTQPTVFVDPSKSFQTILGIGGALTDAAADVFAKLPKRRQREVLQAFYDPKRGIGYTLARTNIHSCDFSSESYTYVDEGDKELKSFSVEHDLARRIPLIRRAISAAGGRLTIFASAWSPPAWMKDTGSMLHGGHLLPAYYQAWANYFAKFIQAYEKEGIPIWGVTVQNEPEANTPWESCQFSASQERDFLKNYLGPTLAKAGLGDRRILIWDHNRDLLYHRVSVILSDPEAAKYAWGIAYHWYEGWYEPGGGEMQFDNVTRTHEAFPEKPLFFTEGTAEHFNPAKIDHWDLGEKYGRSMIHDFNSGAVAWTDWNVLLDEKGGPNHVGNYCFASLHADTRTGALHFTNIYHYIGHFSKFVRPGARRLESVSDRSTLLTTAFRNTDDSLAVVVMNVGDAPIPFDLWIEGHAARTTSPAHSIATLLVR